MTTRINLNGINELDFTNGISSASTSEGITTLAISTTGIDLQTNGVDNSDQAKLNLIAGTNVTLTAGSSGAVTIATSPGITLETNGTANTDQTKLNLVAGTNVTLSSDSTGDVTITASGGGGGGGFSPYPTSLTPPLSADFTVVNFGFGYTVTETDATGRLVVQLSDRYPIVGCIFLSNNTALPSPPYTIDVAASVMAASTSGNGQMVGLGVLDGSNNAVTFSPFLTGATMFRANWTRTGTNIASATTKAFVPSYNGLFFVRLTDDGTTRSFYMSNNGQDYFLFGTEASNTDVTPVTSCIYMYNNTGGLSGEGPAVFSIYNFAVTNSILPAIGS